MREALLELVPDSPVHATLRGLVLDPSTAVVGDERGACVIDRARALGAVIGAPSAATLAAAAGAIEWVSRRPWPSLSGTWERARVAIPRATDVPWVEPDDVVPLTVADLTRVEPELVHALEHALCRGGLARARMRDGEIVSVAYVVTSTERFDDLGVDTREAHRRRGHARAVVGSLVAASLASGRVPVLGALDSNRASIALADSLGFVPVGTLWVAP